MGKPSPESEKLLGTAANLLCQGDFAACRKFALVARDYDPTNPVPDQILAVADVMIAEKTRHPNDWYPILQLTRPDSGNSRLVRTQFEKLTALLDPEENGFPFSDEALRLVNKAWGKVSDLGKKTRVGNGSESPKCEAGLAGAGETFWTVCPFCYGMFEYKKVYEECCLRCQICRKAFHGAAIRVPAPEIMVERKEQYYFTFGCFAMEYRVEPEKSNEELKKKKKGGSVVEISDDEVEEEKEKEVVKNVGGGGEFSGEGKAPGKRMKMPARRTKRKMVERREKMMGEELELGGECGDGDGDGEMDRVEFF